jgi:TonB-dependent receptor
MTREELRGDPLSNPDPVKSYIIDEQTQAAYLMVDYEFADGRVVGDVGVRVVKTENTSWGFFDAGNGPESGEFPTKYTETLPALNLRYAISDSWVMHFAAGRAMARPTFGEVAPRLNISEANQRVSGGNPLLRPYITDQLDVALGYYMGDSGMVSVGVFYKDITDFIQKTTTTDIYPDPTGGGCLMVGGDVDENGCSLFEITTPQNGDNAKVKGVELIVQRDFDFLPGIWGNFGVAANYTYNDSEVDRTAGCAPVAQLPVRLSVGGVCRSEQHQLCPRLCAARLFGRFLVQRQRQVDAASAEPHERKEVGLRGLEAVLAAVR